jgi:predicted nucleic acid-binding protein
MPGSVMAPEGWRVFIDTSALAAGIASSKGAAREVLRMAEAGIIELLVSEQVVVELDRVFAAKFGHLADEHRRYLSRLAPEMVEDPSLAEVRRLAAVIDPGDAGILAAAAQAKADWLLTWDKKHFLNSRVKTAVSCRVADPGEFLAAFRVWLIERM